MTLFLSNFYAPYTKFSMGLFIILCQACSTVSAQPSLLATYTWEKRVLLVFTPHQHLALYQKQLKNFQKANKGVSDRDLVVFRIMEQQGYYPDNQALSAHQVTVLRRYYQVSPQTFQVILVGKDGGEKMRRVQQLLPTQDLFRTIDAMPMRKSEMRKKKKRKKG